MEYAPLDLHCHSTASDGALAPADVVALAATRGIRVLALTDHDTLLGIDAARAAGEKLGVHVVTGIEISAIYPQGQCHLLAWLPERVPASFIAWTQQRMIQRESRAELIVARLNEQGFAIRWEDVQARAVGNIGRPHIADALVAAGYCTGRGDAFQRLIGPGHHAYVPSGKIEPEEAVEAAVAAGGLVSLAHPYTLELEGEPLSDFVGRLADAGLGALEAHRGDHDAVRQAEYRALAIRHGLLVSAGSDFHSLTRANGPRGRRDLGWHGRPGLSDDDRELLLSRLPGVPAALRA